MRKSVDASLRRFYFLKFSVLAFLFRNSFFSVIQSTPDITYYVGTDKKVRYIGAYVILGSKFGNFLIAAVKNGVRYIGEYVILGVRYIGS
jgi:hypothetical protein